MIKKFVGAIAIGCILSAAGALAQTDPCTADQSDPTIDNTFECLFNIFPRSGGADTIGAANPAVFELDWEGLHAALARAYGAYAASISSTAEFEGALKAALAADTPALLHLELDPEAITPTVTLSELAAGG